jgi:hypothetical protein
MFQHTQFLVDRFHYNGHKCSKLFSMDLYSHLRSVNSSILESINGFVQGFKSQLSQMNQKNFMFHIQFIFIIRNRDIIDRVAVTVKWAL